MEPSTLFNGSSGRDDSDYLAWLDTNPESFVANIPHPHTPYDYLPVVLHRASCQDARNSGNAGKLISNTQWKVYDQSLDIVKQGVLRCTQIVLKYCQSNRKRWLWQIPDGRR